MEGLSSLLLFALFFYFMMRFGCGAHRVHGKHDHGQKEGENNQADVDPVCGMEIDSAEGYGKMHNHQLYRFCSRKCLDKFDENPGQYVTA
jgi:YHS domain-containing protein